MTTQMQIDYALMAGHAYRTTRSEINWIPAPSGWTPFFPVPDDSTAAAFPVGNTGFEAIAFKYGSLLKIQGINVSQQTLDNGDELSGQPGLGIVLKTQGRKQSYGAEVDRWALSVHRHLRNHGLNHSGHRAKACFVSVANSMPHSPKKEVAA